MSLKSNKVFSRRFTLVTSAILSATGVAAVIATILLGIIWYDIVINDTTPEWAASEEHLEMTEAEKAESIQELQENNVIMYGIPFLFVWLFVVAPISFIKLSPKSWKQYQKYINNTTSN